MRHRRRVSRQPAGWDGTCHLEGESAAGSRACRVIDISMLGFGMVFTHPSPSELFGRRIYVDVPVVGDSASIRLEGVIKNAVPTLVGTVRVGVAFDLLSVSEPGLAAVKSTRSGRDVDRARRIRIR